MIKNINIKTRLSIVTVFCIIIAGIFYYNKSYISLSDLYKFNNECSEKSVAFAERKTADEYRAWKVLENTFYSKQHSCFAEFSFVNTTGGTTKTIYNLTSNKEIVFVPSLEVNQLQSENKSEVIELYNKYNSDYMIFRDKIFNK